jgi:hypothetical protein
LRPKCKKKTPQKYKNFEPIESCFEVPKRKYNKRGNWKEEGEAVRCVWKNENE